MYLTGHVARAKEIYQSLKIDPKTVYNTLNRLKNDGQIKQVNRESPYEYTAVNTPELILVKLREVMKASFREIYLTDKEKTVIRIVDEMVEKIEDRLNYHEQRREEQLKEEEERKEKKMLNTEVF